MSGTCRALVDLMDRVRDRASHQRPRQGGRSLPLRSMAVTTIPVRGTALVLIDVINDLAFPGAQSLVEHAVRMAAPLAELKRRAVEAGVPIIYVNDNFGQWRSDFRQTVAHCSRKTSPGRVLSRRMRPTATDYFVLKPKHSGFFDTTLDTLLDALRIQRVILTGVAGNICVLFTANDAYMRELRLFVPSDCVASNTAADNEFALRQIKSLLKGNITPSHNLRFGSPGRRRIPRRRGPKKAGVA